jgi:class 3 adenylate cyclase/tetratricopeptide (TPR) repeat protein
VICVQCHSENPDFFRFCGRCGVPLGEACLSCGFENPPESKFCGGCGARMQEVRAEDALGERRQLTVLFCDMAGSTRLAQELDPEDLGRVVGEYQRICGEAVLAHEGHIAQYLGDGVVVYFGYPRSHEDEAQRAVRCGLDILAGVEELRTSGVFPPEMSLDVRLGAHTGRVVVGPVGAGDRKSPIALGDTPNIAARIQSEGEPGTLLVSGATWRIIEGYFTGKSLGERQLKGVSTPIELWLVTGDSGSRDRVEVSTALTPFVDRQDERRRMDTAWKEALSGRSQFVLVRGEPGVGKSRLAQFFQDEVQFEAADLIRMRANPYTSNSPFHPVIEFLERRFRLEHDLTAPERLERLERGLWRFGLHDPESVVLLAYLLSLPVADRYPPLELSPARQRSRTMSVLVDVLSAIARLGPTVLLVEDLHWADTSTTDFLKELIAAAPPVPLMVVMTARPEAELRGDPTILHLIDLVGFGRREAEAMVREVTLGKALPGEILRRILDRSDGVPLFVEELTCSVLDSGMLREREASWEATGAVSDEMIPATVDASLTSRIDRLGPSRATAQLAATIGREFSFSLLLVVSDRDEVTVRRDVERLVQSGLAWPVEGEPDSFQFKHALVRDAAYNSLLRTTRCQHHRRIAAALRERLNHHVSTRPDLIAHHLTSAGEDEEAIAYWETAGQMALARTAVREAAEHFRRAIACLSRLESTREHQERELELLIALAPLLMTIYGWGSVEVEEACQSALVLAQGLRRYDRSYPPMWGLWTVRFLRGELGPALESAEDVFEVAQASGVPMLELTGRHALSFTHWSRAEFGPAVEHAEAGLVLFELEQERLLANLFGLSSSVCLHLSRGNALWMLGRVVDAEEEWNRMVDLGRRLAHPPSLAAALAFSLYAGAFRYSYIGEMERLAGTTDHLLALAREEDFFLWHALAYTFGGIVAQAQGADDARDQMLEGLELWGQTGARLTLVMMNVFCAEALYRLGEDDEAFRRLDVAEAETARGEGPMAPDIWRVRGRLLARQGEYAAAEASYRRALGKAREQGALSLELRAALDLHELVASDGRADESRARLAGILERFAQGLDRPEPARAAAILGGVLDTA